MSKRFRKNFFNNRIIFNFSEVGIFVVIHITKYKALELIFWGGRSELHIGGGSIYIGINLDYRLKNADHLGFDLIINLIFLEIQICFYDVRHQEDYENKK